MGRCDVCRSPCGHHDSPMIVMANTMTLCLPCFSEEANDQEYLAWADYVSSDEEPEDSDYDMDADDDDGPEEIPDSPDVIMEHSPLTPSTTIPEDSVSELSQTYSPASESVHATISEPPFVEEDGELDVITVASSEEPDIASVSSLTDDEALDPEDMDVD